MFSNKPIPAKSGIGLRAQHYQHVANNSGAVSWYEVHPENYFGLGGLPHFYLEKIRQDHPVSFHGVGMSIGSVDHLDMDHLTRLGELIKFYQPEYVSEHLSWSSVNGTFFNDLLPIPYTEEALDHVCSKVNQVQNELDRQIIIENASTYLEFTDSSIPEWDFTNELARRTGCGLLLDVNNVYVNSCNHGFSAKKYLSNVEPRYVKEIHLAGHTLKSVDHTEIRIDSHNQLICKEVWELYQFTIARFGALPTLIEWDTDLPEFFRYYLTKHIRRRALWIESVPKLRDIQEQFARHLQGLSLPPDISRQIKHNSLANKQRLQIYRNNFKISLTNNLGAIYPVIEKLVGKRFFTFTCHEFIGQHPSRQGNLHEYGQEFSVFLKHFEPAQSLAYLPDMAKFEWAYHEVFHEADARSFNLEDLRNIAHSDYPKIVFALNPATRLLTSRYPLLRIWQVNQSGDPEKIKLETGNYFYLIGRRNNENIFQSLSEIDFVFLTLIKSKLGFEKISQKLIQKFDDIQIDFNALLIKHVKTANICDFYIPPKSGK